MKQKFSIKNRIKGFGHALDGLWYFMRTTSNVPIYFLATSVVLALSIYFKINRGEWMWVVFALCIMFVSEIFNSAIEKVVDKASPEQSELAKRSKDMAAAAVLFTALMSLIIGVIIFYPYFDELFS